MTNRLRPWLWLLVLIPVGFGLSRLHFDVEILNLLPDGSPVVRGLKLYQRSFAGANELIITIRATEAAAAEEAAQALAEFLRDETNLISSVHWQPPMAERPDLAAELIAYLWLNQSPGTFHALTNRLAPENLNRILREARERLTTSFSAGEIARYSYDPFALGQLPESVAERGPQWGEGQELFASAKGTFRLVFVQPRQDLRSYKSCTGWLRQIQDRVRDFRVSGQLPEDVLLRFTGRPAFVAEIGGGMERDLAGPSLGTLAVIALLFYLAHRTWRPLIWLIVLLILVVAGTLALGGLIFSTLNVVSLGFASILLGLAEDFAIVLYQEARTHPEFSAAELRRLAAPGIFWSALTTAGAFALLNLSSLPGLAQLGTLVAIGIVLAAIVIPFAYLPPLLGRLRQGHGAATGANTRTPLRLVRSALPLTAVLTLGALMTFCVAPPRFDRSPDALKPKRSEANSALEEVRKRMDQPRDPLWLLVEGRDEAEVADRLNQIQRRLEAQTAQGLIRGFTLPDSLWPRPQHQTANREAAAALVERGDLLRTAARSHGFTADSLAWTDAILDTWQRAIRDPDVFWPTNGSSRWVMDKFAGRTPNGFLAGGMVHVSTNLPASEGLAAAVQAAGPEALLTGWELLGRTIAELVARELPRICLPVAALVLTTLWLAFRKWIDVAFSLAALAFSFIALNTIMGILGWNWNLMNLTALPLLLGLGVDYSIHMQLALHRAAGNWTAVHRSVGRALLLAGSTTAAGFAALAFSSNAGMASLGKICAVGIGCALLTSVYLLPAWWTRFSGPPAGPSSLYRSALWRTGVLFARILPPRSFGRICRGMAALYWHLCRARREVVVANLLPVVNGNRDRALPAARRLFANFAQKLADLWRYESGKAVEPLFGELTGWEHFTTAQAEGRGILLLTPHLGNWEFGAPLLARRGVKLVVITLEEPDAPLTRFRQAARSRWGVETVVIGKDPFAFVDIIRRLDQGATIALLVDRPPEASAVTVDLFGQPFRASVAAAELARASGCILLPTCLPRTDKGYAAQIMPPIPYERPALRDREARRELTRQIMRAFEPAIRQHPDQWYHFVPIWPV